MNGAAMAPATLMPGDGRPPASGTHPAKVMCSAGLDASLIERSYNMDRDIRGMENESKGLNRQVEGKKDEVLGAVTGDTSRELKGKLNKNVGKVQEHIGRKQEEIGDGKDDPGIG